MKKQLLLLVMILLSMVANADVVEIDGIYYEIKTSATGRNRWAFVTTNPNKYYGNIVIPSTIIYEEQEYIVSHISEAAFKDCTELTAIELPEGIGTIASEAFSGCTNLSSIVIPNSVTTIWAGAFEGCSNISSFVIPDKVTSIMARTFKNCRSLTSITIGASVGNIRVDVDLSNENGAFYGCTNLSSINVVPDNSILDSRDNCNAIIRKSDSTLVFGCKNSVIPNSVKYIGAYAFGGCAGLSSINIPNGVEVIDYGAFKNCTDLTSVDISSTVKEIGVAFYDCANLSSINVAPDNPVYDSRENCNAIIETKNNALICGCKNTSIPNSIKAIRSYAFSGSGLPSITIPNSVVEIAISSFRNCPNLSSIIVAPDNPVYDSRDNCNAIIETKSNSLYIGCTNTSIPNSIKTIGSGAFYISSPSSITIPNSVETISASAFAGCIKLYSITFTNSSISIAKDAFVNCNYLKALEFHCDEIKTWFNSNNKINFPYNQIEIITMGDKVESIDDYAFANCTGIKHITIGKGLSNIGVRAFTNIEKLEDVTCYAENVPNTDKTAFESSYPDYAMLYVPESSIDAYKVTAPWSSFKSITAAKDYTPDDAEKCATPTISYSNGNITFDCNTEDVVFVSDIKDDDIKNYTSSSIQISATYKINVYATKTGMKKSDVATATLCWIDVEPKTEGITNSIANVPAKAVLIQAAGGSINVQGCDDGEQLNVYSINGCQVGTAVSQNGAATVNTTLQPASVAIVKVGDKSIKVMMK